jgi:exodeoxyribonuclease V alpha subunit
MAGYDQQLFKNVALRITKQLFERSDTDYRVYGAEPLDPNLQIPVDKFGSLTISGEMGHYDDGTMVKMDILYDEPASHRYDRPSFQLKAIHYGLPEDANGQWAFLGQVLSKSPATLSRLIDNVPPNEKILDLLLNGTLLDKKIKGIGEKTLLKLQALVKKNTDLSILMDAFGDRLTPIAYQHVFDHFGDAKRAIKRIDADPYVLIEVGGIGFKTADKFALAAGVPRNDPRRIRFGMQFVFNTEILPRGNTFASIKFFVARCTAALDVAPVDVNPQLTPEAAWQNGFLVNEEYQLVTSLLMFIKEADLYRDIKRAHKQVWPVLEEKKLKTAITEFEEAHQVHLDDEQRAFLFTANSHGITVLNGAAGTGKTWIINAFVEIMEKHNRKFTLMAPTGRAAKVLRDYTDHTATTIHARLGLMPGFEFSAYTRQGNQDVYGKSDFVVVDESSMLTADLAWEIVRSIVYEKRHLIFVGDAFQLPAIGPGNFLTDLANCAAVATVTLTHVYRQGAKSGILDLASTVRNREPLPFNAAQPAYLSGALRLYNQRDEVTIANTLIAAYHSLWLSAAHDTSQLLLLVNRNKGTLGRMQMNARIQQFACPAVPGRPEYVAPYINPDTEEPDVFRLGDKVMVLQNDGRAQLVDPKDNKRIVQTKDDEDDVAASDRVDYQTTIITNGDTGVITHIDPRRHFLVVHIDDEYIYFSFGGVTNRLALAYAVTVYKSQGGQAKHVLIGLAPSGTMVDAQSFYTAITRAEATVDCYGDFGMLTGKLDYVPTEHRHDLLTNFLNGRLQPDKFGAHTTAQIRDYLAPLPQDAPVPDQSEAAHKPKLRVEVDPTLVDFLKKAQKKDGPES